MAQTMQDLTDNLTRALGQMNRVRLIHTPTPVQRLKNIEYDFRASLGSTRIFVKRDDHMALGGGGNKLRKLEFLLADAIASSADTIITTGGFQSNHARLTAAACAALGLRCELVMRPAVVRENEEHQYGGNILLDQLFGAAVIRIPVVADANSAMEAQAEMHRSMRRRPYVIPAGGSNALGALGYASAALELLAQQSEYAFQVSQIFLANGGSGTHAGLAAGMVAMGRPANIIRSFAVIGEEAAVQAATAAKAAAALDLIGLNLQINLADIRVDGSFRGPAYGSPTAPMVEAVGLLARREGLLLDPVYSGKAFAGLLALIRGNRLRDAGDVVFLMTGGVHTLFGYRDILIPDTSAGKEAVH
jgi:L-cysteate sulfo-lyase